MGWFKLITVPAKNLLELYDLSNDPLELTDLSAENDERVSAMVATLEQWKLAMQSSTEHFAAGGEAELDEESIERLRSLGYIQ